MNDFNPRAPCGARHGAYAFIEPILKFQSTRPMRGATNRPAASIATTVFQSTRPMRGATLRLAFQIQKFYISIHAPHAGRDARSILPMLATMIFQSTRPMRGAT